MPVRYASCPGCGLRDVRALIDVTVHVAVAINGGPHLSVLAERLRDVKRSAHDQGLQSDTDLVCGTCGWIGRPRDLT